MVQVEERGYSALMVDIRDSRSLDEDQRENAQRALIKAVSEVNDIYASSLVKNMMFSAGDEVQGLFADMQNAVLAYRYISLAMLPIGVRGGVGVGGWETRVDSGLSTEQDGDAYHKARAAVSAAKGRGLVGLKIKGIGKSAEACETAIGLCLSVGEGRTNAQQDLAKTIERIRPLVYRNTPIANFTGESSDAVLKNSANRAKAEGSTVPVYIGGDVVESLRSVEASHCCIASDLVDILGVSRQAIEQKLARGSVFIERKAAALAVLSFVDLEGAE